MIKPNWKRIAGIHSLEDGTLGAVWLAHDRDTDVVHVYDCALFKNEVLAVISEGLNARGRSIPVAWGPSAKELAQALLERGCQTLPEPVSDTPEMAEVLSREVDARLRSGRLKADKRLSEWLDEYRSFYREDSQIPRNSHPLMSATRFAIASLQFGRAEQSFSTAKLKYPKRAIA